MSAVYKHTTPKKRRDSFDPRSLNLLREESICMVNLLEIQLNLDYPDSLGPHEIVRIIEGPDNRKYEYIHSR